MAHLQKHTELMLRSSDVVKQQIMEHGAVGASYTHYYAGENHLNNSYYDMQGIVSSGGGHAVMIVGWDDDYSKDNFATTTKPSNNGAWLIRTAGVIILIISGCRMKLIRLQILFGYLVCQQRMGGNNYQLDGGLHTATVGYYTGAANVFYVFRKRRCCI